MLPRLILVFLAVDWPVFSRKRMLAALAESAARHGTTVVAVNRPLCPISTFLRKPHRIPELFRAPGLLEVCPNLHLYSPKYFLHDRVACRSAVTENLNIRALRHSLKSLQERLGVDEPAPIVWYYHPQQGYLTRLYDRAFCIFEMYDNLTDVQGRSDVRALAWEQRWRSEVDLFLATSPGLIQRFGSHYRNVRLLRNGLSRKDFSAMADAMFADSQLLSQIQHPRLGFAGVISARIDWELVDQLSMARPDWNIVFAGRVTHRRYADFMSSRKNIHYLGEFSEQEIPAVIGQFDIGIMPYLDNDFFRVSNPLKFYEFCAAGLASVSSPIRILEDFPPSVVAVRRNDVAEWVAAVDRLLRERDAKTRELCRSTAREHLWEDITDDLLATLERDCENVMDRHASPREGAGR